MIERKRLLSLGYYKRAESFTGSDGTKHYKVEKFKAEDSDDLQLMATVWPGPFCLDKTEPDKLQINYAPFSEDGFLELVNWMNSIEYAED